MNEEKKLPLNDEGIPCHSCQGKKCGENGGWYCDFVSDDNMCEPPDFPLYKETLEEHDKHCEMCQVANEVAEARIRQVAKGMAISRAADTLIEKADDEEVLKWHEKAVQDYRFHQERLEKNHDDKGDRGEMRLAGVNELCEKCKSFTCECMMPRTEEPPATPAEITDPERIAIEKEEAQNKFAYIVKRSKKLDKQGRPKQCGTYPLIFDVDGKDVPVTAIMAIRKQNGKIVAADPLAIIVNQALKMKLRPAHMPREEYAENLEKMMQAAKKQDLGPLQSNDEDLAIAGEVKADE